MKIGKGIKTSEFWVLLAMAAKAFGFGNIINPDSINQTVEVAMRLREFGATESAWMYVLAAVYVAGRTGIKMFEIRYLGKKDESES